MAARSPSEEPAKVRAPFSEQRHPLESSGVLNRALLAWLFPLLLLGRRRPLGAEDVWPVPSWVSSDASASSLRQTWTAQAGRDGKPPSLSAAIISAFGRRAWCIVAVGIYTTAAYQLPPIFLGEFLRALLREDRVDAQPLTFFESGWSWGLLVFAAAVLAGLGPATAHRLQSGVGVEVRNALMCNVYEKLLHVKAESYASLGRHGLSGLCSTVAGVDAERVYLLCHFGGFLLLDFLLICACFPLLVRTAGLVGLWGCAVLLLGSLAQKLFMDRLVLARQEMQAHTDRRLALSQELFENVRSVKLCGLESDLRAQIDAERELELQAQWRVFAVRSLNSAVAYCLVQLALLAILLAASRGSGERLTVPSVFATLAVLNSNRVVFTVLPYELANFSEGLASLRRIRGLLCSAGGGGPSQHRVHRGGKAAALKPEVLAEEGAEVAVVGSAASGRFTIHEGEYSWKVRASAAVDDIRAADAAQGEGQKFDKLLVPALEIPAGSLVLVVGPSGGGKSSLCAAISGWMPRLTGGHKGLGGKVAYCPQEPWVLSGSVEENVLGVGCAHGTCGGGPAVGGNVAAGAGHAEAATWRALQLARLDADVRGFPGAARCEIGFRGLNLSGGQKARLGLARALASSSDASAFIFDDVLSALDAPTAEWIAQRTILGHLDGTTRIVALNSHYEVLLPHADMIVLVEHGLVSTFTSACDFAETKFAGLLARPAEEAEEAEERRCPEWIAAGLPEELSVAELVEDAAAEPQNAGGRGSGTQAHEEGKLYETEFRARGPLDPWLYATYFGFGAATGARGGVPRAVVLLLGLGVLVVLPDAMRLAGEFYLSDALSMAGHVASADWLWHFSLFIGSSFLLALARPLVFMALARRSSRRIYERLMSRLCGAPIPTFFDVVPPGRLMNLCGKDLDAVDTLLPYQSLEFLQDISLLVSTLLVCVVMVPPVLLVLLPAGWLFLQMRRLYVSSARELMRLEATSRSPMLTMLAETVAGLPVIRAQGAEEAMRRRFCALADRNSAFFLHAWALMPWLALWLDELVALVVLATCCSALLLRGTIAPSLMAVALTNNISLLTKVQITCRQSAEVEKLFTAVERLAHALRSTPEEEPEATKAGPPPPDAEWPAAGRISFEAVSLRYRPGLPLVLTELSFEIPPGESVGLIGPSGCGKSTCLRALLRLAEPAGGRVRIDGVDLTGVPLAVLRARVAVVPQEPLVLSGSLRRNLAPWQGRSDEDACWAMLDLLGLSKMARDAPEGLDMELTAGAESTLSLGQRQLLSLGRALLHPSRVLCVDEATANVDGATDAALQRALVLEGRAGGGRPRTRLTVAHRLWTLRHCDEVLLLRPGPPTSIHRIRNPGTGKSRTGRGEDRAGSRQVMSI